VPSSLHDDFGKSRASSHWPANGNAVLVVGSRAARRQAIGKFLPIELPQFDVANAATLHSPIG
jgi:hypothetical protein